MSEPEVHSSASNNSANQIASLQRQVTLQLLALVIISGTLTFYLFFQAHIMGKDLATIRPQATEIIQNYNKNLPNMQKLLDQLTAYGQTHPEFQPILAKYGIAPTNSPAKK